jgi:PAS domain S-box-containing protein
MINKIKTSIELTLLVFIMSLFILGVGVYGILEIKKLNENSRELYSDRLMPMGQLSAIRFHSFHIISTAYKADRKQISYSDALQQVKQAHDSIKANWENYSLTYLTPEEKQLTVKTKFQINKSEVYIERLKLALAHEDETAVAAILEKGLQPSLNSLIAEVSKLLNMQIEIGKKINQNNTNLYDSYTNKFWWILLIVFAIAAPFLYYLIKKNDTVMKTVNLNNAKLFLSEDNFRNLIEYAGEAILILNENAEIIELNEFAVNLLGYSRGELLKMRISDFVAPEDLKKQEADLNLVKKYNSGTLYRRIRKKDGTFIETEISNRVMEGKGFFAIIRDITARRKIEAELVESKDQLRLFIEHSPASLAMFDTEMRYIATSRRWIIDYNLVGQPIIGKTHYEVFPEIGQHWKDIHQRCLKGKVEKKEEDSFLRADGSLEWLQWEIRPWHKSSGEIGGIIMFTEVITERKKATERFKNQFENSPDIILYVNKYFKIEAINRAQPGRTVDELIGMDSIEVLPEESRQIARETLIKCFETNENQEIENVIGNNRWVCSRMVPVSTNGEVTHVMIIATDITEKKKFEDELIRYNSELKKANSELDRFVYSASHDLRAPLKSILGLINITTKDVQEKADKDDKLGLLERLGMLNASAVKLDNFIEDILNYSRNARMEPETNEIAFDDLVHEINSNFKFLQEQNVDFQIINNVCETFYTDKKRLSIILNNVISNAYKYSDHTKENPFINIIFTCDKDKAVIIVKDNGIGIAEADKDKIFDMFYRSTSLSTGSGLGLYIVKEAVEKLNGSYSVTSELGVGTEICIEIPNR